MIKYWEFEALHQDGGREWVNPVEKFIPDGNMLVVDNGFGRWEYDIREIVSWSLLPVYGEEEDE